MHGATIKINKIFCVSLTVNEFNHFRTVPIIIIIIFFTKIESSAFDIIKPPFISWITWVDIGKNISILHQKAFPVTMQNGIFRCINVWRTEAVTSLIFLSIYQHFFFQLLFLISLYYCRSTDKRHERLLPDYLELMHCTPINAMYTIIRRLTWRELQRMSLN